MDDTDDSEQVDQSALDDEWQLAADPALVTLVAFVNDQETFSLGITLNLPGAVVTGQLVPLKQWFAGAVAEYEGGKHDTVAGIYKGLGPQENEEITGLPRHIHLEEAKMSIGASFGPTEGGMRWRGRLSEVAGWTLGVMSAGQL